MLSERERTRSDIPARLTHLVPARVLPARRFKISSPAPPHTDTRTRTFDGPTSPEYLVPAYQREDHHLLPSSSRSLPQRSGLSLSHRRAIRPRLSHRYSRGLLEARGKMRQVVVRSRSPGTREIRLLFSPPFVRPVDPPVRPPAQRRPSAIHSCEYINARVCRARVCAWTRACSGAPRCPQAPCARRGRGRYIIFARWPRQRTN